MKNNIKQLNSLAQIPQNSGLAIYGCGETGIQFFTKVRNERPDIRVNFFIDTFKNGNVEDTKVIKYSECPNHLNTSDLIVVASAFWGQIVSNMNISDIERTFILSNELIYINSPLKSLGDFFFSKDELFENSSKFEMVRSKFTTEGERLLYDELVKLRVHQTDYVPNFFGRYIPTGKQYLEYVGGGFNGVIVEAGAFDGFDTCNIAQLSPNADIHTFEPFPEHISNGVYAENLLNNNRIHIIPKGLDSFSGVKRFGNEGSMSSEIGKNESKSSINVDVITLDDYFKEQNLSSFDYLKMDIEGFEKSALVGGSGCISYYRPRVAVSIYHRKEDLYELPLLLCELLGECKLNLGHYTSTFVDTVLYVTPK